MHNAPSTAHQAPTKHEARSTTHAEGSPHTEGRTEIVIQRTSGWRLVDFGELYRYRDLLWFLTWRNIKVLYAQSIIGIGWAVLQPLFSMIVFTIVFGMFAKMNSDGIPYALFSFCALVPWSYFSNALLDSGNSLVSQADMLSKVYFPRLVLPLSAILAKLVDLGIALMVLGGMMVWYQRPPTWGIVMLPLLIWIMMMTAGGLGMILTSMAIQYRDVKHAMNFLVQLLMYSAPVVYPATLVPEWLQPYYSLNPMVGVIEGFRSALLGTRDMPWSWIGTGLITSTLLFTLGIFQFRKQERVFADVA
ncbi:MAG: ABC transporter permease [Planctomycetota bacterium]|nr:ABC transporter permease [Planctomycetota bacterium]